MDNKLLCEGKKPFVSSASSNKKEAREMSRIYYGLKGLVTQTHSSCPYCHRKSCNDRQVCQGKKNKATASRSIMVQRFFNEKE